MEISQNSGIGDVLMKMPKDKQVEVHLAAGRHTTAEEFLSEIRKLIR